MTTHTPGMPVVRVVSPLFTHVHPRFRYHSPPLKSSRVEGTCSACPPLKSSRVERAAAPSTARMLAGPCGPNSVVCTPPPLPYDTHVPSMSHILVGCHVPLWPKAATMPNWYTSLTGELSNPGSLVAIGLRAGDPYPFGISPTGGGISTLGSILAVPHG